MRNVAPTLSFAHSCATGQCAPCDPTQTGQNEATPAPAPAFDGVSAAVVPSPAERWVLQRQTDRQTHDCWSIHQYTAQPESYQLNVLHIGLLLISLNQSISQLTAALHKLLKKWRDVETWSTGTFSLIAIIKTSADGSFTFCFTVVNVNMWNNSPMFGPIITNTLVKGPKAAVTRWGTGRCLYSAGLERGSGLPGLTRCLLQYYTFKESVYSGFTKSCLNGKIWSSFCNFCEISVLKWLTELWKGRVICCLWQVKFTSLDVFDPCKLRPVMWT